MEPRRNYSQNMITRKCTRCGRWGLIGWYQHKKGWRNGRDYADTIWLDGWTGWCCMCWLRDLTHRTHSWLDTVYGYDRWDDDGGTSLEPN